MQAVILAAGDGGRLSPYTDTLPKPLVPIGGRPVIEHVLSGLYAAGVRESVVVVGYRSEQMRHALAAHDLCEMTVELVENSDYESGNARSLWAVRDVAASGFVLVMADHLVEPAITRAVADGAGARCRLAVERVAPDDTRADVTRAQVRDGLVTDLGKSIPDWNAIDTGTFWCTSAVFDLLADDGARDGELGDVFATIARDGALDAVDVTGRRWIDIDTPEDLRQAEAMLGADGRLA